MSTNVNVTREKVLQLIKTATVPLTTWEMARILKVKERSVRAAIFWLGKAGVVVTDGFIVSQTLMIVRNKTFKGKRKIWLYKWTGKSIAYGRQQIKNMNESDLAEKSRNYGDPVMLQNLMMGMKHA